MRLIIKQSQIISFRKTCKWFLKAISRHLFMTQPSRGDSALAFAREMGHRYHTNGDGWGSMCAAADKLSLINGFSPGHLISLALSLKSNLTLCMSVNINKPSNPALKCHLLCRTWCQAREPIWWRGLLLCVFEMESEGTEKIKKPCSLFRHPSTQSRYSMALVPKPLEILLLPRFVLDSGSTLHCYILQSGFFLIITSYFNLEH